MKNKLKTGLVVCAVLGVVVVAGLGSLKKPKPLPPEKVIVAERGDIARSVVARGKIEPLSKVEVKSKANGIIKALLVDVGDKVTVDQILAELDKEDLQAQVRGATSSLEGEEANLQAAIASEAKARIEADYPELEFARRDYERARGLFSDKIASQQSLDDAERAHELAKNRKQLLEATIRTASAQVTQARARVGAAKAALDRSEENLRYSTIRAPISGIVLTRPTEVGDAVSSILNLGSAASLIMTLGDVSSVYIKGEVDEADIGKAECGQHVRTKVESYPSESFEGVVKRISPMGREQNNVTTFEVRVTISNPEGKLRANMTANAEIVLEEHKGVLLIPESALVYEKDKTVYAQLLDPSTKEGWRKVKVKTGISNGQRTEIADGLKEGEKGGLAVSLAGEILAQTARNIWSHKLRSVLTMFGISWGIASIVFMVAIGEGFKLGYRNMMYSLGTDITILWPGKTSKQAGGQRAGRNVRFSFEDVQAIQKDCPLVKHVTPELDRQLSIRSRQNSGLFSTHGVLPVYQEIRSIRLEAGRPLSEADEADVRPVCVIGEDVRKQLFAGREAVGAEVSIQDVPFKVIGAMAKKDQNNSYNGFDGQKVLVPYSVMARYFPDTRPFIGSTHLDNIIFMPVTADDHDKALKHVKTVLGRRHGFDPGDESAVWAWDTVEAARMVATIYDSMEVFLSCMAIITLGLGGIGVMNIMLISVAERTREIGVKQAVGATRNRILLEFFLEAVMLTIFSGLAGLLVALGICRLVDHLPLPTLFSGLPVTPWTIAMAFGTLVIVGILSAIYPARRASLLTPVEALRYE